MYVEKRFFISFFMVLSFKGNSNTKYCIWLKCPCSLVDGDLSYTTLLSEVIPSFICINRAKSQHERNDKDISITISGIQNC